MMRWRRIRPGHGSPATLTLNSVGALVADPNDSSGNTLYLGTGEGNRCSSGCEAGVGIYKTTNGGDSWTKLPDACVSNTTYSCVNSGDAFLGRGINQIVVDPTNAKHIFVGSALAIRGLSHVIGLPGETQRLEPGANQPGLYESKDGGATFTEVWNGNDAARSVRVTDVGLDPHDPSAVYASAFDRASGGVTPARLRPRSPRCSSRSSYRLSAQCRTTGSADRVWTTGSTGPCSR